MTDFEMSNRLALSLPASDAERYYKEALNAIISSLNVAGLQRMVSITDFLPSTPAYSSESVDWRKWAEKQARKWEAEQSRQKKL